MPLQCLWRDSVTLISTLLLTYYLLTLQMQWRWHENYEKIDKPGSADFSTFSCGWTPQWFSSMSTSLITTFNYVQHFLCHIVNWTSKYKSTRRSVQNALITTNFFNPSECRGNYSATSTQIKLVHCSSAHSPPRSTKCPPINGQCTDHHITV